MCLEQVESFSCFYSPNNTVLTPTYIWFTLHWTFKQPGDYLSHSVGCLHVLCKWYPLLYKRLEHHWVLVSRREAWKQLPDSEYKRTASWPWLITAHGLYSFPVHCLILPKQSLWTIEQAYSLLHFIDRMIEVLLIVICTMSHSTGETGQAWTLTPIPRTRATGMLPISTCCVLHKPQHRVQGMLGMSHPSWDPSLYLTKGEALCLLGLWVT